jgi:hypothetical protein
MDISTAAGTPSLGTTPTTCSTDGYAVPPLAGTVNGQQFLVGASTPTGQAIVCLQYGSTGYDLTVPTSTGSSPVITLNQDSSLALPSPTSDPYPSGTCQSGAAGPYQQYGNTDSPDGHVWLYTSQPNSSTVDLCVRYQGPVTFGGLATVSATPSGGEQPTHGQDSNVSACTSWPLTLSSPVAFAIGYSAPTTSSPIASVCEGSSTTSGTRYWAGITGSGVPNYANWTPDPGSP